MLSRQRVIRLALRIEMLGAPATSRPRLGVIFQERNETEAEAKVRHARTYPEDDVERMLVVGPDPMTCEEWIEKYVRGAA